MTDYSPRGKWGRNTTLSWGLGVGMSCPSSGSRCAMLLDKYPAFLSFLMCPSVTEETIHLPPAPDIFGVVLRRKCELGRWRSSAREWMGREEEGVGEKEESLSLYEGGRNCAPPHLPRKIAYSPSTTIDGAVGLPTPVLMRIP